MTGGARRCSHCGNNGHNSRTCNEGKGCLKLFGVKILAEDKVDNHIHDESVVKTYRKEAIKRSNSVGHLAYHHYNNQLALMPIKNCDVAHIGDGDIVNLEHEPENDPHHGDDGYLSDGLTQYSYCKPKVVRRRKKGVPWTEEEHQTFLIGLKKLGRGDWRGISKNFVHTRNPTQVASHAQKYFMRQMSAKDSTKKKKRRLSLFDLPLKEDLCSIPSASPLLKDSSPLQHGETCFLNGSNDSLDQGELPFPAHQYSQLLPPLSPGPGPGPALTGRPYNGWKRSHIPRLENHADDQANVMTKLNVLALVSPRQVNATTLQLGLPSFASSNKAGGLMSSMVDDMLELRIALPVGTPSE
uniref:Uncharacterized protein n=1 Tax=Kalanchoe fedtschenkoi TaxID=63787 RepID=A0A7N0TBK6_KALFE